MALDLFSVGPVAFVLNRVDPPDWIVTAAIYFYFPIVWAECEAPEAIRSVTRWYLELWT